MASPQQSAAAVATFLGRAGRLAIFAGVGGAALQAALYTGTYSPTKSCLALLVLRELGQTSRTLCCRRTPNFFTLSAVSFQGALLRTYCLDMLPDQGALLKLCTVIASANHAKHE